MDKNINLIVDELISYNNIDNLSWMKVYNEVLNKLNLNKEINNPILLREVVKKISYDGYDINDKPFKLTKYR